MAAGNGTSAMVTKEGDLYIFGKDSSHCDYSTGQVTELKGQIVAQVWPLVRDFIIQSFFQKLILDDCFEKQNQIKKFKNQPPYPRG